MFTIGEFSKITGLTVKTLRFYHEQAILIPTHVDGQTGYRYYAENKIETARVIGRLRELDFSIVEIGRILESHNDEADILDFLENQRTAIAGKLRELRDITKSLDNIINSEKEARLAMTNATFDVEKKTLQSSLIAGIRMKGKYSDCSDGFSKLGRKFGRHINGKAFLLHFDREYKADDADFEACMPIRKGNGTDEINVRELPGGACLSLLHAGPYDEIGGSYQKIISFAKQHGYEIETPTREVYIKGPGMIFKGNPKNYLTEIQLMIQD